MVSDLAEAHLKALEHLLAGGSSRTLSCGCGQGHSMREVLDAVSRVSGRPLAVEPAPRQPGDAAEVVAAAGRAHDERGCQPRHVDLEQIVGDGLRFEAQPPE
jgi:UDP-glucose 4-epimerase